MFGVDLTQRKGNGGGAGRRRLGECNLGFGVSVFVTVFCSRGESYAPSLLVDTKNSNFANRSEITWIVCPSRARFEDRDNEYLCSHNLAV